MGEFRAIGLLEPKYVDDRNGVPHYEANAILILPNRLTFVDDVKQILKKKSSTQEFPKPIRMTGELYLHFYGNCPEGTCTLDYDCYYIYGNIKVHIVDWQGQDRVAFEDSRGGSFVVKQNQIGSYDYKKTFDLTKFFTNVMPIGLFPVKVEFDMSLSCESEQWGLSVSSLSNYGATGTFQVYGSWGW